MTFAFLSLHGALRADNSATLAAGFFAGQAVVGVLLFISLLGIVTFMTGPQPLPRSWLAAFGVMLAMTVAGVELRQKYPANPGNSFSKAFSEYHLQNSNLSESLRTGSRILQGKGNTLESGTGAEPGRINTYRMPGYPILVAAAGLLFRASPADLVSLGAATVYLHVFIFALAVGIFAYAISAIVPRGIAAILVVAVVWFPQSFDMTQNDSVILACGLLICASLCLFYPRMNAASGVPFKYHLFVHLAFASYLLIRSDILIGWAGVSLFLYWRKWKRLLLPAMIFLVIGGLWGQYKVAHGSDFVMTTSNVGHVAFIGLWQTAPHKFVWEPADASYDKWISAHGYTYAEPNANAFAFREVVRFWLTYPGFVMTSFGYKLYAYFRASAWTGSLALYPSIAVGIVMRFVGYWLLLVTIFLAFLIRYEVRRTFLLSWPIFLSLPVFCLLQDSGERFVPFISCSFLFAAVPLLADRGFYAAIAGRAKKLAPLVMFLGILLWFSIPAISTVVLSDSFRYWTPLLDPAQSTLNVIKPY